MANFNGTNGPDSLVGGIDNDRFDAKNGNDTVEAGDGRDTVYAGAGSDSVLGGAGNDWIQGDTILIADVNGQDSLYGEDGNDTILGMGGSDLIDGGEGDDYLVAGANSSSDGSQLSDFDTLLGGNGNDVGEFGVSQGSFDGGDGDDRVELFTSVALVSTVNSDLVVNSANGTGSLQADGQTLVSWTNTESVWLNAGTGDDQITTGDGNDRIDVDRGAATVSTGAGDDHVTYVRGSANVLDGGDGYDVLEISGSGGGPVNALDVRDITTFNDGFGTTITGFEEIQVDGSSANDVFLLGDSDDRIDGWNGGDVLFGGLGDDVLNGEYSRDRLIGGEGNDRLRGQENDDKVNGGLGNDTVKGGSGSDTVSGGDGDDRVMGGNGSDTLSGGAGSDQFVFGELSVSGTDHIVDFESGTDTILVEAFLIPGSVDEGPLDPALFAAGAPVGTGGQFVLLDAGGAAPTLVWDPDGTGANAGSAVLTLGAGQTMTADDIYIY